MADGALSPELQARIQTLQTMSAQLQSVAQQRAQFELVASETKRARAALEEADADAPVYRTVGGIMIRDDRDKALERLGDDADTMEIRLKRAREQEEKLQTDLEQLQESLQKELQGQA